MKPGWTTPLEILGGLHKTCRPSHEPANLRRTLGVDQGVPLRSICLLYFYINNLNAKLVGIGSSAVEAMLFRFAPTRNDHLDRRIESAVLLEEKVDAWEEDRSQEPVKIEWQFATKDACIKLTGPHSITQ